MSTSLSSNRSRALPLPSRPQLTLVPKAAAARASRVPFAAFVLVLLAVGLLGLLLLNTSLQRGAYVQADLQQRADALTHQQQGLEMSVQTKSDPQRIAEAATSLGMVQSPHPAFLSLADGSISGRPAEGVAGQTFLQRDRHDAAASKIPPEGSTVGGGTTGAVTVDPTGPAGTNGVDTRSGSHEARQVRDRKNDRLRRSQ